MLKAVQAFTYQGITFQAGADIPPIAIEADDLAILLARGVVINTTPQPESDNPPDRQAKRRVK